jgi:hypothetical protein
MAAALATATACEVAAQDARSMFLMTTTTQNHRLNPAMLREGNISFLLGNIGVGANANIGLGNFVYPTTGNPDYELTTFMHPSVSAAEFLGKLHKNNKLNVAADVTLFSVAFRALKGVNLVELNVRSNTSATLPYELFDFMKQAGEKEYYSFKDLGANSQNYAELALGHSHAIGKHLTIGAKLKLLVGAGYANLDVKRMDVTLTGDRWNINADARADMALFDTHFKLNEEKMKEGKHRVSGIDDVKVGIAGMGVAVDLGATYKFPTRIVDGLTVSASVLDLGFINWNKSNRATSQGNYTFDGFKDPIYTGIGDNNKGGDVEHPNSIGKQVDALVDDVKEMFSLYDEGRQTANSMLAATINVGARYEMPFYRPFSVGVLYTQRVQGRYSWEQATMLAGVHPLKWLEVSANGSYSSLAGMSTGGVLSLRAPHFNFFVGADYNFRKIGYLSAGTPVLPVGRAGINASLGINFPL